MNAIENIISFQLVQKLGWTLLHFIWQATVVALLLAVLLRILRRFSANLRYVTACLALGLIVFLPVVTMQVINVPPPHQEPPESRIPYTESIPQTAELQISVTSPPSSVIYEPVRQESARKNYFAALKQHAADVLEPALPHIVTGWLLGVFALSIWHLGGWTQLQRLRKKMVKQVDTSLKSKLNRLSEKLGVRQAVELLESALVQIPTVVGWIKPVILLPASALTGLNTEQLEAILAHELAHIKRLDYLVNMLQTVVEILGFYHPAVWWISHKIRAERENCCDDLAVTVTGDRVRYARALTSMEEIRGRSSELAVAATGGNLFSRIRRLIGKDSSEKTFSWIPATTVILLLAALLIPAAIAITSASETEQPDNQPSNAEKTDSDTKVLIETQIIHVSDDFLKQVGLDADSLKNSNSWTQFRVDDSSSPTMFVIDSHTKEILLKNVDESENSSSISRIYLMAMSGREAMIKNYSGYDFKSQELGRFIKIKPELSQDGQSTSIDCELLIRRFKNFNLFSDVYINKKVDQNVVSESEIVEYKVNAENAQLPDNHTLLILGGKLVSLRDVEKRQPILRHIPFTGELFNTTSRIEGQANEIILIKTSIDPAERSDDVDSKASSYNLAKIEELVRMYLDLYLEEGQYVEIKDIGKRKFILKQVTADSIGKGRGDFPAYASYIDFEIRSNVDLNLSTQRFTRGPLFEHDKWDAYFTSPDTIIGNGYFSPTILCVCAWRLKIWSRSPLDKLDDTQVSLVAVKIKPNTPQQPSAEVEKDDPNQAAIEKTLIDGFRANRDKFKCGILAWTKTTENDGFAGQNEKYETKGSFQLWWDGNKIATKYVDEILQAGPRGNKIVAEIGGNTYNGSLLSIKPKYKHNENWFQQVSWTGSFTLDKEIAEMKKFKDGSLNWSIIGGEEGKQIKLTIKNTQNNFSGIRYFDISKGYNLIRDESYSSKGQLYSLKTRKLHQIGDGWFPIELDSKSFDIESGKLTHNNHFVLDLDRCSFNDPAAIPKGIFEFSTLKEQERLNKILEKYSKDTTADANDENTQNVCESVENYIAFALAGEDEKAAEYADPKSAVVRQTDDTRQVFKGQPAQIIAVCSGEWNALAISSVILADHGRTGTVVFKLKKEILDQKVHWLIDDIDIETLDSIESEIKRFLERNPQAKTILFKPQRPVITPIGSSGKQTDIQNDMTAESNRHTVKLPVSRRTQIQPRLQIRKVAVEPIELPNSEILAYNTISTPSKRLHVQKKILFDEADIIKAEFQQSDDTSQAILLQLTEEAAERMEIIKYDNIGRQLAIVFDGTILTALTISAQMSSEKLMVDISSLNGPSENSIITQVNEAIKTASVQNPMFEMVGWSEADIALKKAMDRDPSFGNSYKHAPQKLAIKAWEELIKRDDITEEQRLYATWRIASLCAGNMDPSLGEKPDVEKSERLFKHAMYMIPGLYCSETVNSATQYASHRGTSLESAERLIESYCFLKAATPEMIAQSSELINKNCRVLDKKFFSNIAKLPDATIEERTKLLNRIVDGGLETIDKSVSGFLKSCNDETAGVYLLNSLEGVADPEVLERWRSINSKIGSTWGNLQIKFNSNMQVGSEEVWGEVVDDVQVRLRGEKTVWQTDGAGQFRVDIISDTERVLPRYGPPLDVFEVSIDDIWYQRSSDFFAGLRSVGPSPAKRRDRLYFGFDSKHWKRKSNGVSMYPIMGKHVIRVAFPFTSTDGEKALAVSNPIEIEILPGEDFAKQLVDGALRAESVKVEVPWGEAAEGAQIRLLNATQIPGRSDSPHPVVQLRLDARNRGERYLHLPENGFNWQIEVDGIWYEWVNPQLHITPIDREKTISLRGGRFLDFNPGNSHARLTADIVSDWRRIPEGKEAEFGQRHWSSAGWPLIDNDGYGPDLIFKPGQHRVRVAVICAPSRAGFYRTVRLTSNPVEIEILPEEYSDDVQVEAEQADPNEKSPEPLSRELTIDQLDYINNLPSVKIIKEKLVQVEKELITARQTYTESHPQVRHLTKLKEDLKKRLGEIKDMPIEELKKQEYIDNQPNVKALYEKFAQVEQELIEAHQIYTESHPQVRRLNELKEDLSKSLNEKRQQVGKLYDQGVNTQSRQEQQVISAKAEPNKPELLNHIMIEAGITMVSDEFLEFVGLDANSLSKSDTWSKYRVADSNDSARFIIDPNNTDMLIKTIESRDDCEILSQSRVIAINGRRAIIQLINEFYYLTSRKFKFALCDAGSFIEMTPQLTEDKKNIWLNCKLNLNYPSKKPIIKILRTLVPDNQTLLIICPKINAWTERQTSVPILGQLPLVGGTFHYTSKITEEVRPLLLIKPIFIPLPFDSNNKDLITELVNKKLRR